MKRARPFVYGFSYCIGGMQWYRQSDGWYETDWGWQVFSTDGSFYLFVTGGQALRDAGGYIDGVALCDNNRGIKRALALACDAIQAKLWKE